MGRGVFLMHRLDNVRGEFNLTFLEDRSVLAAVVLT